MYLQNHFSSLRTRILNSMRSIQIPSPFSCQCSTKNWWSFHLQIVSVKCGLQLFRRESSSENIRIKTGAGHETHFRFDWFPQRKTLIWSDISDSISRSIKKKLSQRKRERESEMEYVKISPDRFGDVIEHLRYTFFVDEPLNKASKLCAGGVVHSLTEAYCVKTLSDGLSVMALTADQQVLERLNFNERS